MSGMTSMNDFKMPLVIIGIIGLLVLSGCVNPNPQHPDQNPDSQPDPVDSEWVYYAPVQAPTNPWQVNATPVSDEYSEMDQVNAWLHASGISFQHAGFIPHDDVTCAALNCARGDYLIIHPSDNINQIKLHTLGFKDYTEVGVITSGENGNVSITMVNASSETIYYGGCNDFTFQNESKVGSPNYKPFIVPKTCIWEGIPSKLPGGDSISFNYTITDPGIWTVVFGYGTKCVEGQPLSQANCEQTSVAYSFPIDVSSYGTATEVYMIYDIKQCHTNPWQGGTDAPDLSIEMDQQMFSQWVNDLGLHPLSISYVPAEPNTIVCLSCACSSGS